MAKKTHPKKDKKMGRTETVRAAVDQAFQATAQATADAGQLTRERATEIADELVGNITRLRDALDDVRPATTDDSKALRAELASLSERVGRLETARAAAAITGTDPAAKPAARSATARRGGAKPAAAKPSARASASRTAAAKRTTAAAAAASKPKAAKKPKPTPPAKTGAATKQPAARS